MVLENHWGQGPPTATEIDKEFLMDHVHWVTPPRGQPPCTACASPALTSRPGARQRHGSRGRGRIVQAEDVLERHGFQVVTSLTNGVASARLVRTDGQTVDEYLRKLDVAKELRAHLAANARPKPADAVDCVSVTDVATRAFVSNEPLAQLGSCPPLQLRAGAVRP